jgi:hypothetical protein
VAALTVFGLLAMVSGCASLVSASMGRLADSLTNGILNQNDPKTVADGAPAYLLLVDGLIEDNPRDPSLLGAGTKLYSAYASVFVSDHERRLRMTEKALDYAGRRLCVLHKAACGARSMHFGRFSKVVAGLDKDDVPALYDFSVAWAGWIQARSDDWSAIADLAKVRAGLERVVALDGKYENGGPQMYLGVLATLVPPTLGGKPEVSRKYFDRAVELSGGRNLMIKVQYADHYARVVFNRPLYERLLKEVLGGKTVAPGLTLSNTLAQQEARKMLAKAPEIF